MCALGACREAFGGFVCGASLRRLCVGSAADCCWRGKARPRGAFPLRRLHHHKTSPCQGPTRGGVRCSGPPAAAPSPLDLCGPKATEAKRPEGGGAHLQRLHPHVVALEQEDPVALQQAGVLGHGVNPAARDARTRSRGSGDRLTGRRLAHARSWEGPAWKAGARRARREEAGGRGEASAPFTPGGRPRGFALRRAALTQLAGHLHALPPSLCLLLPLLSPALLHGVGPPWRPCTLPLCSWLPAQHASAATRTTAARRWGGRPRGSRSRCRTRGAAAWRGTWGSAAHVSTGTETHARALAHLPPHSPHAPTASCSCCGNGGAATPGVPCGGQSAPPGSPTRRGEAACPKLAAARLAPLPHLLGDAVVLHAVEDAREARELLAAWHLLNQLVGAVPARPITQVRKKHQGNATTGPTSVQACPCSLAHAAGCPVRPREYPLPCSAPRRLVGGLT